LGNAVEPDFQSTLRALAVSSVERALPKDSFIERSALINPAAILSLDLILIPRARIRLEHDGSVGFEYAPFCLFNGLAEGTASNLRIPPLNHGRGAAPPVFLPYIHDTSKILHSAPHMQNSEF
jgi:hypothetical protein